MKTIFYSLFVNYNFFQISGVPLYLALVPTFKFRFVKGFVLVFIFFSVLTVFSNDYQQSLFFLVNLLVAYLLWSQKLNYRLLWNMLIISCLIALLDQVIFDRYLASLLYVDGNGTHSQLFGFLEVFRFGAFFSEPSRLALVLVMTLYLLNEFDTVRPADAYICVFAVLATVSLSGLLLLAYLSLSLLVKNRSRKVSLGRIIVYLSIVGGFIFVVDTALSVFSSKYVNVETMIATEPRFEKIWFAIAPLMSGDLLSAPGFFGYATEYGVNTGNWILFWLHDYRLVGMVVVVSLLFGLVRRVGPIDAGFFVAFYSLNSENHLIFIAPIVWILLNEKKLTGDRTSFFRHDRHWSYSSQSAA